MLVSRMMFNYVWIVIVCVKLVYGFGDININNDKCKEIATILNINDINELLPENNNDNNGFYVVSNIPLTMNEQSMTNNISLIYGLGTIIVILLFTFYWTYSTGIYFQQKQTQKQQKQTQQTPQNTQLNLNLAIANNNNNNNNNNNTLLSIPTPNLSVAPVPLTFKGKCHIFCKSLGLSFFFKHAILHS